MSRPDHLARLTEIARSAWDLHMRPVKTSDSVSVRNDERDRIWLHLVSAGHALIAAAKDPADPVTFDENWSERDHDDKMAHNAESAPEDEGDD